MKVILSNQSEFPIYAQIREQIKEQILDGRIKEGEVLPSIRQLARDLGISVITTTRAYRDLESEGFIASVQGKGSIVLKSDNEVLLEQYQKRLKECLLEAAALVEKLGISGEELAETLKKMTDGSR